MNFIIAILLATILTFAYFFLKERKKIAHKNYDIDELHKIMDEQKQEIYELRQNYIRDLGEKVEERKYTVNCDNNQALNMINHKSINYGPIAQLVGLTQHQRNKRLAEMQNNESMQKAYKNE